MIGRGSWIFAAKLLLSLIAIVFAATISVTSSTYQAETGSIVSFPTGFLVTDKGFTAAPAAVSAFGTCGSPATFSIDTTANTAITAGHFVYDVQVNATSGAQPLTTYTVTFALGSATLGPVCVRTLAVVSGTVDCKFDIGSNALPSSPYTYKLTIQ